VWRVVAQVPAAKSRLQSGDVFILDMGIKLFQWNGSDASPFEKNKVGRAAWTLEWACLSVSSGTRS